MVATWIMRKEKQHKKFKKSVLWFNLIVFIFDIWFFVRRKCTIKQYQTLSNKAKPSQELLRERFPHQSVELISAHNLINKLLLDIITILHWLTWGKVSHYFMISLVCYQIKIFFDPFTLINIKQIKRHVKRGKVM